MTFIIAGRIKDAKFMMSECIATDEGKQSFAEKTIELKSSPGTFYSLTGVSFIGECFQLLDYFYHSKGLKLDLINDANSLKSFLFYVDKAIETSPYKPVNLKKNRFFFVSDDGVSYIDLFYSIQGKLLNEPIVINVPEGYYVDSAIQFPMEEIEVPDLHESGIRDFCLDHILSLSKGRNIDFKDRFNFTMFSEGNDVVVELPFKYPSDILAWMNKLPFEIIDDADFKFNLIE